MAKKPNPFANFGKKAQENAEFKQGQFVQMQEGKFLCELVDVDTETYQSGAKGILWVWKLISGVSPEGEETDPALNGKTQKHRFGFENDIAMQKLAGAMQSAGIDVENDCGTAGRALDACETLIGKKATVYAAFQKDKAGNIRTNTHGNPFFNYSVEEWEEGDAGEKAAAPVVESKAPEPSAEEDLWED